MNRGSVVQSENVQEFTEKKFREIQGPDFEQLARSKERNISYTVVGGTFRI